MKNILAILLVAVVLLTEGTGITPVDEALPAGVNFAGGEKILPYIKPPPPPKEKPKPIKTVFTPDKKLSAKETVEAFFEQQYTGYLALRYIDVTSIVDTEKKSNRNMLSWLKIMMMRRRLIAQNGLGYVETEALPYKIVYDTTPNDNRMELWRDYLSRNRETVIHFHFEGEAGKVYPPFMAANTQHSMFLKQTGGVWKIEMHYFPGSSRKFTNIDSIKPPSEAEMLKQLKAEFKAHAEPVPPGEPAEARVYDAKKAVWYAKKYTEETNPQFTRLGDWVGDCANFVSQCVWAGFGGGDSITSDWRPESVAWINVNTFWGYMTGGWELGGQEMPGVSSLKVGDIVKTRTDSGNTKSNFTHILILVDEEKLVFAQNTPGAFVYYSDLANVDVRFIRPAYLIK